MNSTSYWKNQPSLFLGIFISHFQMVRLSITFFSLVVNFFISIPRVVLLLSFLNQTIIIQLIFIKLQVLLIQWRSFDDSYFWISLTKSWCKRLLQLHWRPLYNGLSLFAGVGDCLSVPRLVLPQPSPCLGENYGLTFLHLPKIYLWENFFE